VQKTLLAKNTKHTKKTTSGSRGMGRSQKVVKVYNFTEMQQISSLPLPGKTFVVFYDERALRVSGRVRKKIYSLRQACIGARFYGFRMVFGVMRLESSHHKPKQRKVTNFMQQNLVSLPRVSPKPSRDSQILSKARTSVSIKKHSR
jgi:hypothetical protein